MIGESVKTAEVRSINSDVIHLQIGALWQVPRPRLPRHPSFALAASPGCPTLSVIRPGHR